MVLNTRTLVRDPALDVMNVGNRISRLLAEALSAFEWAGRDSVRAAWVPPVDVLEQDDAIRIVAELPGLPPEDVQLPGGATSSPSTARTASRPPSPPSGCTVRSGCTG